MKFLKSFLVHDETPRAHRKRTAPASMELEKTLFEERGHDLDDFSESIRNFFITSQSYYFKSVYQSAIAKKIGLNINRHEDMRRFLEHLAKDFGIYRKLKSEWVNEQSEPSIDIMISYFHKFALLRPEFEVPCFDDFVASVKSSAARTVTFIRVCPPSKNREPSDKDNYRFQLKECWNRIRSKGYYKELKLGRSKKKSHVLKQQAMDLIRDEFASCFWFEPDTLGHYQRWVDSRLLEGRPKTCDDPEDILYNDRLFSWAMFKYSTYVRIDNGNYDGKNPHHWLWDKTAPCYARIWGGP